MSSGSLSSNKGIFGQAGEQSNMTSVQWFSDGTAVTGGGNGQLYHWQGRELQKAVQVHGSGQAVHSLIIVNDKVFSGGKDNKVVELDSAFNKVKEHVLQSYPRALDMHEGNLLVGTHDGVITEIKANGSQTRLMESHYDGEVWGLCVDSSNNIVVSSADDNQVKAWSVQQRKCVGTGTVDKVKGPVRKAAQGASTLAVTGTNQQSRALAFNNVNGHIAVGHNDGRVTVRTGQHRRYTRRC